MTEGQVEVRVSKCIETIRVLEVIRVAVSRRQHGQDELPTADCRARAVDVLGRHPTLELHRAVVPEALLDRIRDRVGRAAKPLDLVGMPEQSHQAIAQ